MNFRTFRIGLAVLLPAVVIDGRAAPAQPHHGTLPEPKATLGSDRLEIPMDLSTRHPIIEVRINGKGPFRFVFDTGAGGTMIDKAVTEGMDLPTLGMAQVGDATGKGHRTMPLVKIDSIQIGGAEFKGSIGIVGDFGHVFPGDDRPDGILAFKTFAGCLVTLDYPNRRLILERGELPPTDGKNTLDYADEHNIPVLRLKVGGTTIPIAIDSGASMAGVLAESLEGTVPIVDEPVTVGIARRFNTEMDVRESRVDASIHLGRHVIEKPVFHFAGVQSVIGYHILRHFATTFDQKNHRVRFLRESNEPITFEPRYSAGFGADLIDGRRTVWYVMDTLPAAQAGLRKGDVIRTVNGRDAAGFARGEWRALSEGPAELRLAVERDGEEIEIVIQTMLMVR